LNVDDFNYSGVADDGRIVKAAIGVGAAIVFEKLKRA
jgi:hypothetical protein